MLGISQHLFAINVLVWCVQSSIECSGKNVLLHQSVSTYTECSVSSLGLPCMSSWVVLHCLGGLLLRHVLLSFTTSCNECSGLVTVCAPNARALPWSCLACPLAHPPNAGGHPGIRGFESLTDFPCQTFGKRPTFQADFGESLRNSHRRWHF